jgi:hypothetical protein
MSWVLFVNRIFFRGRGFPLAGGHLIFSLIISLAHERGRVRSRSLFFPVKIMIRKFFYDFWPAGNAVFLLDLFSYGEVEALFLV